MLGLIAWIRSKINQKPQIIMAQIVQLVEVLMAAN
jgi:hypothetical protein